MESLFDEDCNRVGGNNGDEECDARLWDEANPQSLRSLWQEQQLQSTHCDDGHEDDERPRVKMQSEHRTAVACISGRDVQADLSKRNATAENRGQNAQAVALRIITRVDFAHRSAAEQPRRTRGAEHHPHALQDAERTGHFVLEELRAKRAEQHARDCDDTELRKQSAERAH